VEEGQDGAGQTGRAKANELKGNRKWKESPRRCMEYGENMLTRLRYTGTAVTPVNNLSALFRFFFLLSYTVPSSSFFY